MKTNEKKTSGQASIEFAFLIVIILGFVVTIMISGVREAEVTLALSAARLGAKEFVSQNQAYYFTSMNYFIEGRRIFLEPMFFSWETGEAELPPGSTDLVLEKIGEVVARGSTKQCSEGICCMAAVNHDYCIAEED